MRKSILILIISAIAFSSYGQSDEEISSLYENTVKSLVTVVTENALGSGFFIAPNLIVTNFHVVGSSPEVKLKFIGNDELEDIIGHVALDEENDLIILKTAKEYDNFIKLDIQEPKPGTKVYSFGSPKGLEATMSNGLISALRKDDNDKVFLIQHDAPLSPGNSGGPLLNSKGKMVGINVAKMDDGENLNFAIPANILEELSFNMGFLENFPVESSHEGPTVDVDIDYEKRAMELVEQLGDMIEIIADKNEDSQIRKEAVKQATSLFVSPESIVEVSSKNTSHIKKVPVNKYFIRLFQLPYTDVDIQWSELAYATDFKPGPDGKLYALISVSQKFTGKVDGRVVYTDITIKHIEVMIDTIEKAWGTSYKIYLNSINVESTV